MNSASLGAVFALGSSLTWAFSSSVFARLARKHGVAQVSIGRGLVVAPIYLLAALLLHGDTAFAGLDLRRLGWLFASTVCSFGFGDAIFLTATHFIGISRALALASIYPLWTALIGVFVLGEQLSSMRALGVLLCVVGVVALILLQDEHREGQGIPRPPRRARVVGVALALLASACWAINGLAIKEGATGISIPVANGVRNGFAVCLLLLLINLRSRRARRLDTRASPTLRPAKLWVPRAAWREFLPAILFDGILGSLMFVYAFAHADLSVVAPLSSLAPLFAVPAALVAGDERFSFSRSAAIFATVGGVVLIVANSP